jgi:hypothetical protein
MIGPDEYSAPNALGCEKEQKGERMLARILKEQSFIWNSDGIAVRLELDTNKKLSEALKSDGDLLSLQMVAHYDQMSHAQTEKLLSLGWKPINTALQAVV